MPLKKLFYVFPLALFLGLAGNLPIPAADESVNADDQQLKAAGVGTEPAELIAFLRKHTLADKDRQQIETLIRQLGHEQFARREEASDKLVAIGPSAVSFLREATRDSNVEVSKRAEQCLTEIGGATDPALLATAVRSLARHRPDEGVSVLLEFFPFAGEEWLEEEVLVALGSLGVKSGKPEQILLSGLEDTLPARRAAAVNVLARWGDAEQRSAVRTLLADPELKVRSFAAKGLLGDRFQRQDVPLNLEDKKFVKAAKVNSDAAALLAYFRSRTLSDEERRGLEALMVELDSNTFAIRKDAAEKIAAIGPSALPFLAEALERKNGLELTRRLGNCKVEIQQKGPPSGVPMAAARLLVRRNPAEAVRTLIDFVPYADDSSVEEEVLMAVSQLAVQGMKLPPELLAALKDELPARRATAALAIGMVGEREQIALVKPLLTDDEPRVRLRAAQGLLAARDKEAIPVLVALLGEGPTPWATQAESLLQSIGGEKAPTQSMSDGTPDARKTSHEAWAAWWRDNGDKLNLADGPQGTPFLGLTMIAELTSNNGTGGNRVYEFGADGKPRWELKDMQFPIDAQWLRGDRVLIAEYNSNRVIERDRGGKIVWEFKVMNGNPVSCQRLANGNTLICTYTNVMEVTPGSKVVYNHAINTLVGGQQIYNAIKLRNGNIACITGGTLLIVDTSGKKVKDYMLGNNNFNWAGVEELPGGKFLVALMGTGKVMEVGGDGKPTWEVSVPGCCHAVRLPSGNTLVACMQQQKVVEVDRSGKVVWEQQTAGRPFHVRRR